VYEEDISLTHVTTRDGTAPVRANAPCAETNDPVSQTSRLALSPNEPSVCVDGEVITLIDAKRDEHLKSAADELSENRGLGPLPDIHRMATQLPRIAKRVHLLEAPRLCDPQARDMAQLPQLRRQTA
jgi:hypothetical protein